MHDGMRSALSIIRVLLIGILLLAIIPILFRKPASTMTGIGEIAIHASALSLSDETWSGNCRLIECIDLPPADEVAFGVHEYFPYRLVTVRDEETGDILIAVSSPLNLLEGIDAASRRDPSIRAVLRETDAIVYMGELNSGSWPARTFSIISSH